MRPLHATRLTRSGAGATSNWGLPLVDPDSTQVDIARIDEDCFNPRDWHSGPPKRESVTAIL
jgi:hypothetical protein